MRVIEQIKAIPGMQRYRYLWMTIGIFSFMGPIHMRSEIFNLKIN